MEILDQSLRSDTFTFKVKPKKANALNEAKKRWLLFYEQKQLWVTKKKVMITV
jgi:hypothetical protein